MCEGGRRNRRAPDELGSYALRQRDLELYVISKTQGYCTILNVKQYAASAASGDPAKF